MAYPSSSVVYWFRRRFGICQVRRVKLVLTMTRFRESSSAVVHHRMGGIGVAILAFFVTMALVAPLLPLPNWDASLFPSFQDPSWAHPFGTDQNGRDILARVVWGSRVALLVGLLPRVICGVSGTRLGAVPGC